MTLSGGKAGLAAAGTALAISLTGCSGAVNTAGDTTCKEFLTHDEDTQNDEIDQMLKDDNHRDPSGLQTIATRNSVLVYCKTLGNENSKINESPHF